MKYGGPSWGPPRSAPAFSQEMSVLCPGRASVASGLEPLQACPLSIHSGHSRVGLGLVQLGVVRLLMGLNLQIDVGDRKFLVRILRAADASQRRFRI